MVTINADGDEITINADFDGDEIDDVFSPLMWACYEGDDDRVDELLEEEAPVEEKDDWGWTALMHACCAEHNGYIIRTLIGHGANVNVADIWGVTPLMVTFMYASYNEWELRLGGVALDAVDNEGRTALMYACDAGDTSGMQLCYNKARVDIIDNNKRSALDHALESKKISLDIVNCIMNKMGELKTKSKENDRLLLDTLSRWVTRYTKEIEESRTKRRHRWGGHPERFLLRDRSYDLALSLIYEDMDDNGESSDKDDKFHGLAPLMYACIKGNADLIIYLCSHKGTFFSPDFKDEELDLAKYQEEMEELAVEAQKFDKYLAENPDVRRKILFGV
uniref:Ankyrin repeat protein n=1 Tax=Marseillevirus LCMAC101 TaxID=2506602 RepID=A0A481YQY5_9VIRU|nr:MAG: ankyrin repeat protein [Marseillevirus LCMAC101]